MNEWMKHHLLFLYILRWSRKCAMNENPEFHANKDSRYRCRNALHFDDNFSQRPCTWERSLPRGKMFTRILEFNHELYCSKLKKHTFLKNISKMIFPPSQINCYIWSANFVPNQLRHLVRELSSNLNAAFQYFFFYFS